MTKQEYQEYLQTPHWKRVQYAMYHIRPEDCELCHQPTHTYNIHHISYDNIGNEQFYDLVVLCERCHKDTHKNKYNIKRRETKQLIYKSLLFNMIVYSGMTYCEARNELNQPYYNDVLQNEDYEITTIGNCLDRVLNEIMNPEGIIYV